MTPSPAFASVPSIFTQGSDTDDYDAPLPSFVGLGLAAYATPADLGALADRAEAGVSGLQLIFDAQAAGAIELPQRLADQLRVLLGRATGSVSTVPPKSYVQLALIS
jgi:hypothetical protein